MVCVVFSTSVAFVDVVIDALAIDATVVVVAAAVAVVGTGVANCFAAAVI